MSGAEWVREAPCAGDARFTPDDADELSARQTRKLLALCRHCPFRARCISLVQPRRSRFDGVCGGRLWRNGAIERSCRGAHESELTEGTGPLNHGTPAGARAHNRRGERACALCREAGRRDQARRRAAKRASET